MTQTKTIFQFAILEGDAVKPSQLILIMTDGTKEFYKILNDADKALINNRFNVERIGAYKQ
jgi:hypothetical protein